MSEEVEWLVSGEAIRASLIGPKTKEVVVTFDHWRADRAGFDKIAPYSWFTAQGFGHLRIQTAKNDFYINADIGAAQDMLARACEGLGPRRMLGFSMGAFGALLFGRALAARSALLISPSLPRYLPDGADLRDCAEGPDYTLVYDPTIARDSWSAAVLLDLVPKTTLVTLVGGGHPATGAICRAGKFNEVRRLATSAAQHPLALADLHREAALPSGDPA